MNKKNIPIKYVYIVLISLSLLITLGTHIYLKLTNTDGIILNDNLTVEFRSEVYINDFIKELDGKLIDNYLVDTNEVGYKDLVITYKNNYGFIVGKDITIEVIDVIPPTIVVNNPYTIEVGSVSNLKDTIFCADNYYDNIDCNIKGEYDLEREGKYKLEISATDGANNTTSKEFTLNVIPKQVKTNTNTTTRYTDFRSIYSKYKNNDTLIGLDISKWQGDVDYSKLKAEGVDFVMLKIGGQTKINGEFIIDPKFYNNIEGAINNGIKVGVYFYSYANDILEARAQADWIMLKLGDYDIDMPIVFDWENWSKYSTFDISFNTLNKVAKTFIDRVEELGYDGVLYSSKYYLENIWYRDEYTNWLAYYNSDFNEYKDYYMWQMCSNGKINGIDGYVDIDIMYTGN